MTADAWPVVARVPPLTINDVHVWRAALDRDEPTVQRLEALLAEDERQRAERFHFRKDRQRYVVGRGLLRLLLAEYGAGKPMIQQLCYTSHGKPGLSGEKQEGGLKFSIAHSDSLVLYAVSRGREIGVDVERVRPGVDWRELAQQYFAPQEIAELTGLLPEFQEQAFFAGWTRKEAYLKALGFGMTVPLDRFAITLTPGQTPALIVAEHDPSQLGRWEFRELTPAPGYCGALAVEGQGWRFFCGQWEPFA